MESVTASFTVEDFGTKKIENVDRSAIETRFAEMKQILKF